MAPYLTFTGCIIPMAWGTSTYTVLPIPDDISDQLRARGAKRVEGEIADHPVNLALTKAPVISQSFLYTGKAFLRDTGIEPGELIEVRLRPAPDTEVEVPDDLMHAIHAADLRAVWEALAPGRQRGLIHTVQTAKRADTRANRIAKLIAEIT